MIIPVPVTASEIKIRRKKTFEEHLVRQATTIGYVNRNRQEVIAKTDRPGTDHNQRVYLLRCHICSNEYGSDGSDIHLRRCPSCQGGAPGLATA